MRVDAQARVLLSSGEAGTTLGLCSVIAVAVAFDRMSLQVSVKGLSHNHVNSTVSGVLGEIAVIILFICK